MIVSSLTSNIIDSREAAPEKATTMTEFQEVVEKWLESLQEPLRGVMAEHYSGQDNKLKVYTPAHHGKLLKQGQALARIQLRHLLHG